jgi:hypothetical protein
MSVFMRRTKRPTAMRNDIKRQTGGKPQWLISRESLRRKS